MASANQEVMDCGWVMARPHHDVKAPASTGAACASRRACGCDPLQNTGVARRGDGLAQELEVRGRRRIFSRPPAMSHRLQKAPLHHPSMQEQSAMISVSPRKASTVSSKVRPSRRGRCRGIDSHHIPKPRLAMPERPCTVSASVGSDVNISCPLSKGRPMSRGFPPWPLMAA